MGGPKERGEELRLADPCRHDTMLNFIAEGLGESFPTPETCSSDSCSTNPFRHKTRRCWAADRPRGGQVSHSRRRLTLGGWI